MPAPLARVGPRALRPRAAALPRVAVLRRARPVPPDAARLLGVVVREPHRRHERVRCRRGARAGRRRRAPLPTRRARAGPGPRENGGRGVGRRARARRGSALRARGLPRNFPRRGRARDGASLRQRYLPVPAASEDGEGTVGGLREAWAAVRDDDVFRRLLVASFLFGTGCWIQTPAHPLLLVDVLHVSTAQVGVFAAAAAAATLVGGAWWGGLVDRRSSLDALWMMYLVGAATPAICALAWNPWLLVASSVTDALVGIGLDVVWLMVVIDIAGPTRAAQYVAIGATLAGVRGVLGPLLGGLLIGALGVRAVYLVAFALMGGAAWLVAWERGRRAVVYSQS